MAYSESREATLYQLPLSYWVPIVKTNSENAPAAPFLKLLEVETSPRLQGVITIGRRLLPGLLQTPQLTTFLSALGDTGELSEEQRKALVPLRAARQEYLAERADEGSVKLRHLIGRAALESLPSDIRRPQAARLVMALMKGADIRLLSDEDDRLSDANYYFANLSEAGTFVYREAPILVTGSAGKLTKLVDDKSECFKPESAEARQLSATVLQLWEEADDNRQQTIDFLAPLAMAA